MVEFLGNPQPGGCYVAEVFKESTLQRAGVQRGDMLYEINGHRIDMYGEMNVPWSEDKISIIDYVSRLAIGDEVRLVIYRNGQRKELSVTFNQAELPPIHKIYPGYEKIDYEIFAGMVVMPLTANHIQGMKKSFVGLIRFAEIKNQTHPTLIITHLFPTSQLFRARTIMVGATINELNGEQVHTLDDFRRVIKEHAQSKFLTLRVSDNVAMTTDNVFVVLPMATCIQEETRLARDFCYQITDTVKEIMKLHGISTATKNVSQ